MSYQSMRKPEMDFYDNLQCWNCLKPFSSKWHLDKHLEAGKCEHHMAKRQTKMKVKKQKVKMYICVCGKSVDGITLDRHLQSGTCK